MPNWTILSENFRLTPWSLEEHAAFVLQEYGKLLSTPEKAQAYVDGYKEAEEKFDEAYANQQEFLDRSTAASGAPPQILPPIARIDWDPVKKMAKIIQESLPVEVPAEVPVEPVETLEA